jgi:hypothetical protein
MGIMRPLFTLLITTLALSTVGAQSRPDFTGTWTIDAEDAARTAGLEHSHAPRQAITSTATTVAVTRTWATRIHGELLLPDNVSRNEEDHPGGLAQARSRWNGDRLETEWTQAVALPRAVRTLTTREVRWLQGAQMVVETTWSDGLSSVTRTARYTRVLQ